MKPKIGQTVYTLEYERLWDEWHITPEKAFALGSSSFVVDDYAEKTESAWNYADYGKKWFSSLKVAKSHANKLSGKRLKWAASPNGTYYYGSKHEKIS